MPDTSAAERIRLWSEALFEELLPEQQQPNVPVLLACDDETIRVVADRLGFNVEDPSHQFGRDVAVAFGVGKLAGWKQVVAADWQRLPQPRPLPHFFPVLCLWVLAASRMAPDDRHPTNEYHGRLCSLIDVRGAESLPCFRFIGPRFHDLSKWLEDDLQGRHGCLLVPENPHPEHVGFAVEQTVFRLRDRQVLSTFFAERMRGSLDGFDPLRRLQRWSGRGALTQHARRLLEGAEFADRVRAGIRSAFRSWDGAELEETHGGVGRFWPALVRVVFNPHPALQFGRQTREGRLAPLELTLEGTPQSLEAGRELPLPWDYLDRLRHSTLTLGDPRSAGGAIRLPRFGETVLFEGGEEGLLRVEQPSAEHVWVLTNSGQLQEQLQRRRFRGGELPFGWELFFDVPVAELPGIERAPIAEPQLSPLRLEGGLPLGRPRYLSGFPPVLAAGDLESEEKLAVVINGNPYGSIASSTRLELPDAPGRYELTVGDGDFTTSYDVEERGEPLEEQLWHTLSDERALRTGAQARADGERMGVAVSGAHVEPPFSGQLPLLVRFPHDLETIDTAGALHRHPRPPTPAWLKEVGLDHRGRWEVFCDDGVWLLVEGVRKRVRLLADRELAALSPEAASVVRAFGERVDFLRHSVPLDVIRERWQALVERASGTAS